MLTNIEARAELFAVIAVRRARSPTRAQFRSFTGSEVRKRCDD
jgi:hypothetical protein